ncbi:ubiquitin carboxyl-terminal hydrolase 25 [Asparagus officinalis]|nr:ubiquitin carboxyl-terminal hydrolase 25 [Asparagus officinalis]
MREIFGGALLSQVKCLSCKGESNKTDEIMDISLDLFQSNSLKDALGRFFQPEVLDGNNKYNCSKCKKLSVAKKQMFILRAPNVLVVQLKRFEGIHGGKINRNIEFEEVLVLSKFMYSTSQDLQPEYNLFGSIVHSGFSPESGHYYAYIKDPVGRWYCCNDAHVSLSSTQEVLSEKVYILFYLRNNQSPRSSKSCPPCKTKPAVSDRIEVSPQHKTTELSKPSIFGSNGISSKNNVSTILKNGKTSTNPQIKSINIKNHELKKAIANENGNSKVHTNGSMEKNGDHKLTPAVKKNKPHDNGSTEKLKVGNMSDFSSSSKSGIVDGISSNMVGNGEKQTLQTPNGNGYSNMFKIAPGEDNAKILASVDKNIDYDRPSNDMVAKNDSVTTAPKRKSCDTESNGRLDVGTKEPNASCKTHAQCHSTRAEDVENFKKLIAAEASSDLRSCGWVDEVHKFMHARKKICSQVNGGCPDNTELRRQLIIDAKKNFISQIPESLKEHLVERLRSFSQGKPLFDA